MAAKLDAEQLRRYVRDHAAGYLDRPNVTSVGIGHKIVDGKRTKEVCIQFTVGRKLRPEALASEGVAPLPASVTVNGVAVPTDVVERSFSPGYKIVHPEAIAKDVRKTRLDPVVPGCSVAHPRLTAGTLGAIVYDNDTGSPCVLSNWHVLQGALGKIGDLVVQPGPFDDNRIDANPLGTLLRSHLGPAGDCAIARIEQRGFAADVLDLGVVPAEIGVCDLGDLVVKSGRTTAVTHGVVTRVDTVVKLDYGDGAGERQIGGFEIGPAANAPASGGIISKDGDSGSAWLAADAGGKAKPVLLGLHVAGSGSISPDEHAIACYAPSVFEKLQIGLAPVAGQAAGAIGFDPRFLAVPIELPGVGGKLRRDVLKVEGGTVVDHTHFSLAMSKSRRFALWVAWNVDGRALKAFGRTGLKFQDDPAVGPAEQVGDELYASNRLDRGHIARRADLVWGADAEAQAANRQSFYFTNITPQHQAFNQSRAGGLWGELEDAIFEDVEVEQLRISVMGGPVLSADDPVYRDVKIPREFWKVVALVNAATGRLEAKGYILTQADLLNRVEALELDPFKLYRVALARIEERTGLSFGQLKEADQQTARAGVAHAQAEPAGIWEIVTREQIAR